jgi:RNA polymerase-binding protein DksA
VVLLSQQQVSRDGLGGVAVWPQPSGAPILARTPRAVGLWEVRMAQHTSSGGTTRSRGASAHSRSRTSSTPTIAATRASAKKTVTKKAVVKKAPVKKAPVKKSAVKKAPVKKAPAKKAAVKKAPAKKAAVKKAPAKKAPAKKAPAKKAPAKKAAAKKAPVKKAAAKKAPAKKAPVKKAPVKKAPAKKAPAKKAAAAPPPPKPAPIAPAPVKPVVPLKKAAVAPKRSARGRKPLTPAERDEMRGVLRAERVRLKAEIATAVKDLNELLRDSGDGSGDDQADAGSKTFEREHEMSVANNSRDLLEQVEHALKRISDGSYGTCENCGLPIGKMRLEAFPRATLCVDCKQREERR